MVCGELERLSRSVIVPAHCTGWVHRVGDNCTGWAAQRVFADRFPAAFIPNTVGTRFDL
jgi:metal-dependent hydrolase (beta-lactamase superfamily II)